jgi:hypothetical protein
LTFEVCEKEMSFPLPKSENTPQIQSIETKVPDYVCSIKVSCFGRLWTLYPKVGPFPEK